MKKHLTLLLVCILTVIPISACSRSTATASVPGYCSNIRVEAKVGAEGIVEISVLSHRETAGIGDYGIIATIARINEKQSVAIDAVAGATVSSLAAISAAEQAVSKLNIDIESFFLPPASDATEYLSLNYDVAIIGAGGAGLTAAIAAAEQGAKVVILEKLGIPGGSTARSDGKIMASESDLQRKHRETDSAGSFAGYLYEYADKSLGSFRQLELAEHSAANIAFLETIGLRFSDTLYAAYEGQNPKRVHLVVSNNENGGGLLIKPLMDKALSLGVEVLYNTAVDELLQHPDGKIIGVRGRSAFGHIITVNSNSVVIATGGFDRNDTLLSEYHLVSSLSISGVGNTGDGINLARKAGAAIFNTASLIATIEDINTGQFDVTGLILDPAGERIENEAGNTFLLSCKLLARGYTTAYLIVDSVAYKKAVRNGLDENSVITADSVSELAQKLGMPDAEFTIDQYNIMCRAKADSEYGKSSQHLSAIEKGPFCAVPLSFKTYGTLGGIITNSRCQVLNSDGNVIAGLYAAGEVMNGSYFITGFPAFGASLAQVIETGRISGKMAGESALKK